MLTDQIGVLIIILITVLIISTVTEPFTSPISYGYGYGSILTQPMQQEMLKIYAQRQKQQSSNAAQFRVLQSELAKIPGELPKNRAKTAINLSRTASRVMYS